VTAPVWLLDVDGVVNALDPGVTAWPDFRTFRARGFVIRFSPTLLGRIADLHSAGRVEVQWLTTWWDSANAYLAEEFGLPELGVANTEEEFAFRGGWWKLPVAQRLAAAGRRLVWTDDDLDHVDDATAWVREQHGRVLALSPNTYVGLTPEDLAAVEAWL
jgi:hypothetical protein